MSSNHTKRDQQICFLHPWTSALVHTRLWSEDKYSFIVLLSLLCVKMPYEHWRISQKTLSTVGDNKLNLSSPLSPVRSAGSWNWLSSVGWVEQHVTENHQSWTGRTTSWSAVLSVAAWFVASKSASYMPWVIVITSGQSNHGQSQRTRKEIDLHWSSPPTDWILNPPEDKNFTDFSFFFFNLLYVLAKKVFFLSQSQTFLFLS